MTAARPLSSEPQPLTDEQASRIRAVLLPHLRAEAVAPAPVAERPTRKRRSA